MRYTIIAINSDGKIIEYQQVDVKYTGYTRTIKPQAEVNIEQKIKDGISKKVLRHLFSECDYFETIKQETPMVYDNLKQKLKFRRFGINLAFKIRKI